MDWNWLESLWLAGHKIPVGKVSKVAFDWMKQNLKPVFDFMSTVMEALISGILWLLQTPHPLVIVALAVALAWYLQRSWKICLLVLLGLLFILNQGYWKPTTESLTLILASCVVCMGIGVPVVRALNSVNTALGFESGFVIVIVAIVLDRMLRKGEMK